MKPGWEKWLWGGLGWAMLGPIGGILGFALGAVRDQTKFEDQGRVEEAYPRTRPGDFGVSLLVLFAAVMRADEKLLKSELDFVKDFFERNFGAKYARERMILFKDILAQDYPLRDVCHQIRRNMDHPSRLELIHLLFGLARADGSITPSEIDAIRKICGYLGVSPADFESIKAMFVKDTTSAYKVLEVDPNADEETVKRAYRRMANKYHPDKVNHLGEDFLVVAEDKFKAINTAYQQIRQERGF
ncbi:MAG: TerB family tellurite resistance protein [Fidelibacterota bacterium]|nr:MAG: TerB family tellurite resistance protein [Candidatus Neomarinimicrobiota bacterium]